MFVQFVRGVMSNENWCIIFNAKLSFARRWALLLKEINESWRNFFAATEQVGEFPIHHVIRPKCLNQRLQIQFKMQFYQTKFCTYNNLHVFFKSFTWMFQKSSKLNKSHHSSFLISFNYLVPNKTTLKWQDLIHSSITGQVNLFDFNLRRIKYYIYIFITELLPKLLLAGEGIYIREKKRSVGADL